MLVIVFITTFIFLTLSETQIKVPMLDGRVVGGRFTDIELYPYQVSLVYGARQLCGGSIIGKTKILTAAHCTHQRSPKKISVRTGSSYHNREGQTINVKEFCQHPDYNTWNLDFDVTVVTLVWSIEFGQRTKIINLQPQFNILPAKTKGIVTGWATNLAHKLRRLEVKLISNKACEAVYGKNSITKRMICFGPLKETIEACQGVSGNPLKVRDMQVGVASWGKGCTKSNQPTVYAHVSTLRSHIDKC